MVVDSGGLAALIQGVMRRFFPLLFTPLLLISIHASVAEEKNGISVTVQKVTLDKSDSRGGYYMERINRTQGLKVTVKNVSFKDMKEGEVDWQILVKRYYASGIVSYTGTEKLKALKAADGQDMTIGAAQISGWKEGGSMEKDKIEWQIIVKQDGIETMRAQSTSTFDSLAKHAVKASPSNTGGGN